MLEAPLIIDDIISTKYQTLLLNTVLGGSDFQWHYQKDITYDNNALASAEFANSNIIERPGLSHLFYDSLGTGSTESSKYFSLILPLAFEAAAKANINFDFIGKARSFLQFPSNPNHPNGLINHPHIDMPFPHTVLLYYINDSDGDTIIYNETLSDIPDNEVKINNTTILTRVTPKKGRCVFFNGIHYHSSSQPINRTRAVINFNLFNNKA